MLSNTMTGEDWRKHMKTKVKTAKRLQDAERKGDARAKTSAPKPLPQNLCPKTSTEDSALACRNLDKYGTLEVGKLADIPILEADSLADIHRAEIGNEGRAND
jgi:cytosine/adenosine deaminase-related metal-dependent hydrolase